MRKQFWKERINIVFSVEKGRKIIGKVIVEGGSGWSGK